MVVPEPPPGKLSALALTSFQQVSGQYQYD